MNSFRIADLTYAQSPACGYAYTATYAYTGLNDYIFENPNDNGEININAVLGGA
jgi:hypothetical protein